MRQPRAARVLRALAVLICTLAVLPQEARAEPPLAPQLASTSAPPLLQGPAREADESGLAVLSPADLERYRAIFTAQEAGRWAQADAQIARLENRVLMGYVLFQRYMHPTAYRSSYAELRDWLASYADLPEADRIYKLALKKKPKGAPDPEKPTRRFVRGAPREPSAFEVYNPRRSNAERAAVSAVERKVRDLLSRERPSQALAYIEGAAVRDRLTRVEFNTLKQWIATSYLAERVDERALEIARQAVAAEPKGVPLAYWSAGLAAWRLGRVGEAASYFETLANAEHIDGDTRAAAAYWAARGYLRERAPQKVTPLLAVAAAAPDSFYGLLAAFQMGRMPDLTRRAATPSPEALAAVLASPGVERAIALAQLGRKETAEEELCRAHGPLARQNDAALVAIAEELGFAAAQLQVARALDDDAFLAMHYPVPGYVPEGGFTIDRALLYAFVHKESAFRVDAQSHAGAVGLMQVMPVTARTLTGDDKLSKAERERLFDPGYNLALGQSYIAQIMTRVEPRGNLFKMAVAYNSGPTNMARWIDLLGPLAEDPLLFIESVPVAETRGYVERVMTNLWLYRARLGQPADTIAQVAAGGWPVYEPLDRSARPLAEAAGALHAAN